MRREASLSPPSNSAFDTFAVVQGTLEALRKAGSRFLILRHSPALTPFERELDILVPPRSKGEFIAQFLATAPPCLRCISVSTGLTGARVVLLHSLAIGVGFAPAYVLDIREIIIKDATVLASFDDVAHFGLHVRDGLPVPAASAEAALLIARNVWSNRPLSDKHRAILTQAWSENVLGVLPRFLIASNGDGYEAVFNNAKRAVAPRNRNRKRLLTWMRIVMRHWSAGIPRLAFRRPSVLAIHGPDGVGKTTAAGALANMLVSLNVRVMAQHYAGQEITEGYIATQDRKASRPARSVTPSSGRFTAIAARLLLFPARHIQFLLDVHSKRDVDIAVYDRFCFDHLFKGEAALGMSHRIRRVAASVGRAIRLSYKTVNIVMIADPAVIRRRKAEMSEAEIREYYHCADLYFAEDLVRVQASGSSAEVSNRLLGSFITEIDLKLRKKAQSL